MFRESRQLKIWIHHMTGNYQGRLLQKLYIPRVNQLLGSTTGGLLGMILHSSQDTIPI